METAKLGPLAFYKVPGWGCWGGLVGWIWGAWVGLGAVVKTWNSSRAGTFLSVLPPAAFTCQAHILSQGCGI